ncbi:MAG: B12-binding domain-containing radical SAM protein [Deltaproteobacteria bacterium]|nr:B12-binding domain-containing radical SAM protein [Deltaproteobacteria bacterium]
MYPKSMTLPSYFSSATNISTDAEETLPPLGILYIISNSKYNIDFIDNRIKQYKFDQLLDILTVYDVVGFGGTIFEIKEARKLSYELMKKGIVTIYGGPNATANWNLYVNCFNIIFRGEGEVAFDQIIENINSLEKIGLHQIERTYFNEEIYRNKNLNSLAFPDRSKINLDDYKRTEKSYLKEVFPVDTVVSSRGCPFNCYFCSSNLIWSKKYSYRSVDSVISEIKFMIKNYATRGVYFREDNFTINRNRVVEFCKKVQKLNIKWLCESRVDTIDEDLIKIMSKSGCKGIWFGIESTDNKVLKKIGKGITNEQIKSTIDLCEDNNIRTGGGFMLGFPFDDKESILRNYRESKKLNLSVRFYNRVWAIPISKMYYDIIDKNLDYYCFENIILPSTEYMTADEVNRLYFKLISKKFILDKKIALILGKRRIEFIRNKFPKTVNIYRKLLS